MPDKSVLSIADPPYHIGDKTTYRGAGKLKSRVLLQESKKFEQWYKAPSQEFFDELERISKHRIIWGGNYFSLPPTRCVICWDKVQPWENFSQIEMAWTDFDMPAKLFQFDNRTGDKIHATQKPVELYAWLLRTFAKEGDVIFDPMMGSQSSRIAAYKMGFEYIGCEIDEEYYKRGCKRFEDECLGIHHTKSGKIVVEQSLFDV